MKEIDTKISVVWPSWCYTDKANCNVIKECHKIEKNFDVNIYRDTSDDSRKKIQSQIDCSNTPLTLPALVQLLLPATTIVAEKTMLSESSILLSGYSNNNTINSTTRNRETSNTPLSAISLSVQGTGLTITPTTTTAAAAAYLYLEKVKNERMSPRVTTAQLDSLKDAIMESSAVVAVAAAMVNNNNSISSNNINNNNNYNSSSGTANNYKNNVNSTNNSLVNSQFQNQICSNSTSNTSNSNELHNHSITPSCNQSLQQQRPLLKQSHHHNQQQQHQQESLHMNSNHVKKERLSPGTNGDHQTCISRSRSTTPSSFSGTPPDSSPPDASGSMYNLSTNLLKSIHHTAASSRQSNISVSSSSVTSASLGIPTDFSTRNYSDFMRSLAAKYNNTNPNDNLKRNILLEATLSNKNAQNKSLAAAQKAAFIISPSTPLNKDVTVTTTSSLPAPTLLPTLPIPPSESLVKVSQQNKFVTAVANAAVACSSNASPYMTSFLSSLPFSPGIFPHLIDMSSTQALITLARAAKEHEIHNILSFPSQHQKRSATSTPPSPSPSLNVALQQAAQFISPALIYSVQLQKKQLQQQQQQYHQQQSQDSRQSSPCLVKISNSATSSTSSKTYRNLGEKVNVSPLDLSSQPPATKRFKAESTSSQSSTDGLMHTTITRSASSSTATMSPSPPPITEKSLSASAIVVPATFVTASLVVDSSSKTEETATAITPIKIASSAAVTSSITPAVTVRQCQAQSEELNSWTVDDVCAFVRSIDICAEYVKSFRDQCIDGSGLPLLTEDHLVNSLGMKLGPALKLRSVLAKKLGGPCPCVSCVAQIQQVLALQASGITATAATAEQTTTGATATNISAVGSYTKISGSCNSHLANRTLAASNGTVKCSSYNSVINSSFANKNESIIATTSTIATNTSTASVVSFDATTTNVCNSHGNTSSRTRSNRSSLNINVDNFSSPTPPLLPPPPATSAIITLQQQHYLKQKQPEHQQSALQNICNSKGDNNPTTNRHDKDDSIS